METEKAKRILAAPNSAPYPEKLENLLTIEEAAKLWDTPAVTIRAKCKAGFFGNFARKMGGQWILTPEAMYRWKGPRYIESGKHVPGTDTIPVWEEMKWIVYPEALKHLNAPELNALKKFLKTTLPPQIAKDMEW